MSEEGRGGVMRTVVAAAEAELRGHREAAGGEQLELLPAATRLGGAEAAALQLELRARQGPGRPKGAANLATKEFREFLLKTGVSPLIQMMRWSLHTPQTLAAELGCTPAEAFALLKSLWVELAPYLHQRMPQAIEVDQRSAGVLIVGRITTDQAVQLREQLGVDLELVSAPGEQNQQLSAAAAAKSHDEKSHGGAK